MLGDTIVALASAPGSSERAVLRVSGPRAFDVVTRVFAPAVPVARGLVHGHVAVRRARLPAFALAMPGPRSFTGEHVVELHVPGSPVLVQLLLDALVADGAAAGVRLAVPGEFTARAVQNGRMDGARVEGLWLLLQATDGAAAAAALPWLRGELGEAVARLRARLQDVLATLEAGLDFTDEELVAPSAAAQVTTLQTIAAATASLLATVPVASPGGAWLLHGRSNAGKSALVNALAGHEAVLVDAVAGTTRDVLRIELPGGGTLLDAPGDLDSPVGIDAQALEWRDRLVGGAAGRILVVAADQPQWPASDRAPARLPLVAFVWTKCDRCAQPPHPEGLGDGVPVFATSARDGTGLPALRAWLQARRQGGVVDAGANLRSALQSAVAGVRRAAAAAAAGHGPELVAVDVQAGLAALDGLLGHHSVEQVLDRIYRDFCLGK